MARNIGIGRGMRGAARRSTLSPTATLRRVLGCSGLPLIPLRRGRQRNPGGARIDEPFRDVTIWDTLR